MWHVIVQPAGSDEKHYRDTVLQAVPVSLVLRLVPTADRDELARVFGDRPTIQVWGVTPGEDGTNATKWQRIEAGDLALFSKSNVIFSRAFVAAKVQAPGLARELWGQRDDGQTWEYIYFLDEVERLNWPVPDFNEAAEYQPNKVIRGFNVLNDRKSQRVLAALGIVSQRYRPAISEQEYLDALAQLTDVELNTPRVTAARVEQQYLRQLLFGQNPTAECCMCGRQFPVDLLIAAHIKRRTDCSQEERLDRNVVAPVCELGCDPLFEDGYIVIDDTGTIRARQQELHTPDLQTALQRLIGRKCTAWNDRTKAYFAFHAQRFDLEIPVGR